MSPEFATRLIVVLITSGVPGLIVNVAADTGATMITRVTIISPAETRLLRIRHIYANNSFVLTNDEVMRVFTDAI